MSACCPVITLDTDQPAFAEGMEDKKGSVSKLVANVVAGVVFFPSILLISLTHF
jgi:hypothetical protein